MSANGHVRRGSRAGARAFAAVATLGLVACGAPFAATDGAGSTSGASVSTGAAGGAGGATTTSAGGAGGTVTATSAGGAGGAVTTSAGGATSTGAGGAAGAGGATTTSPPDAGAGCPSQEACLSTGMPVGFAGPVLLYGAAGPNASPACPAGWQVLDPKPKPMGDANVSGTCQFDCKPTIVPTCGNPLFEVHAACKLSSLGASPATPGQCYGGGGTAAGIDPPPTSSPPACGAPDAPKLPPPFSKAAWRCGLGAEPSSACEGGECAPSPTKDASVCVMTSGDVLCPDANQSSYTEKVVLVDSFADERVCGAPQCDASAACPTALELFSDAQCGVSVATVPGGGCKDAAFQSYRATLIDGGAAAVKCAKGGGAIAGTVTLSQVTTLCCAK